jgi:large subunit ribosomal protein L15
MKLSDLRPAKGAKSASKRVGRGKGSGLGRTAGRGEKGLRARSGGGTPPGYEGGQMPMQRRIPKRGFHNVFRAAGIVKNIKDGVKLLGNGEVSRAVTVKVDKASKEAARKVAEAGGTLEVAPSC